MATALPMTQTDKVRGEYLLRLGDDALVLGQRLDGNPRQLLDRRSLDRNGGNDVRADYCPA